MIAVNGTVITDDQVARETQYHPAPSKEAATREAAKALVIRALLLQEAAALGVGADGDSRAAGREDPPDAPAAEERRIAALLDREITVPAPDDAEMRRYYDGHRERFRSPDVYEASHILFMAPPGRPQEREQARAAASLTLGELSRDPGAFERLARERSADPESREQGGHIGQIVRGQTAPAFEACLASLSPGELCREPVATKYGYHVVRLDRAVKGRQLTYEMARERIAEYLGAAAWNRAVHQYIQLLVGKAVIQGIELPGATTPLVQ